MNILIPNATGPSNPGDQAMLYTLLEILEKAVSDLQLTIHTTNSTSYYNLKYQVRPTFLEYIFLIQKSFIHKISSLLQCGFILLLLLLSPFLVKHLIKRRSVLGKMMWDYFDSDYVVFVGGGYFRSKRGISQSINILLLLIPLLICKRTQKKFVVAPISFGPFAYRWQERLCAYFLADATLVAAREDISFNILRKYNVRNLYSSTDHALFIPKKQLSFHEELLVGYTIRNWYDYLKQDALELAYSEALSRIYHRKKIVIQPIVQVTTPDFPKEDDLAPTKRVVALLRKNDVKSKPIMIIKSLSHAQRVYGNLDLLVGMRMHSNIIAAVQEVPFVAIAYEHKTRGIARTLGLESIALDSQDVTPNKLEKLIDAVLSKRLYYKNILKRNLENLRTIEENFWIDLFISLNNKS